jgi:hypothetical protein
MENNSIKHEPISYESLMSFWTPIDWMSSRQKVRGNKRFFKGAKIILEKLKGLKFDIEDSESFGVAYKIISDAIVDYCERYEVIRPNKKRTPPVPFEIIEALYILVYAKCYLRFYEITYPDPESMKTKDLKNSVIDGVNAELMEYQLKKLGIYEVNTEAMERRLKELGLTFDEVVAKSKKYRLQYNILSESKIGCDPVKDFRNNTIFQHDVGFEYPGKKSGKYGEMLSEVVKYHKNYIGHDTYADIFGGSGQALLYVPVFSDVKEYLNDFSTLNVNFYEVVRDQYKRVKLEEFAVKAVNAIETQPNLDILEVGINELNKRRENAWQSYKWAAKAFEAAKRVSQRSDAT